MGSARRLVSLGMALLIALPCAAAAKEPRRKRKQKQKQATAQAAAQQAAAPQAGCQRCQGTLVLLLRDEGPPAAPLAAFRYRLRMGEQVIEGQCPQQAGEGGRCTGEGVRLEVPGGEAEVSLYIEAQGMRPMLHTAHLVGCCPQVEVRLSLRRL